MKCILKCIREIAYAIGLLIVALIVGNILFMALNDLFGDRTETYTESEKQGWVMLFALVVMLGYIIKKIFWRKKSLPPPTD